MGAPTPATVGLKGTLHWTPGRVMTPWRNLNRSEPRKGVSIVSQPTQPDWPPRTLSGDLHCVPQNPMVESRAFWRGVDAKRSFPHLWKKLWKSEGFRVNQRKP